MPAPPRKPGPKVVESESEEEFEETDEEEEEVDPVEKINALPLAQRRRIYALKKLANDAKALKRNCRDRIAAIERDFLAKMAPLFELRRKIVMGEHDPSPAEIEKANEKKKNESRVEEIEDSDDEEKKKKPADAAKHVKVTAPSDLEEKDALTEAAGRPNGGIPHFWLTAMKNSEVLESMVTRRDEEALKALQNVTSSFIDDDPRKGFKLAFTFAENPFFSNKLLTKEYRFDPEDEDYALEDCIGCPIDWSSRENKLTVVIKEKKQRHKSGKGVRIVQREEKCPSFFHFFDPPKMNDDDEEGKEQEDEEDDVDGVLEMDFEAGQAFHEQLIPRAVYYYTGDSIADLASGMMDYGDDEDDEEGDDEEESEEEEAPPAIAQRGGKNNRGGGAGAARGGFQAGPARGGRGGAENPECKQQ